MVLSVQKMNWKFRTGAHEQTGVSLKEPLPDNPRGAYTREHQDTAHIPHPSDGDPPIFPGAFFPRTAHPNSVMLSSHERRDTKRLCLRSVVWGSCYRLSKCTRSNICPL